MKIKILQHQVHVMKSLIGGMLPLGQRYGVWYVPFVEFKDFCIFCNEVTMFFFPGWLHHHWYNSRQWQCRQCRQCRGGYTHWIFFMLAVSQAQFFTLLRWTLVNLQLSGSIHQWRVFFAQPFCLESCLGSFRTMAECQVSQAMVRCHPHQLSEVRCLVWWFLMLLVHGMQHANSTFYTVLYFNHS